MDILTRLRREEGAEEHLSSSCPTSFDFASAMRAQRRMSESVSLRSLPSSIDIRGAATLCFSEDGRAFRGVVATEDACNYSIVGSRTPRRRLPKRDAFEEENDDLLTEEEPEGTPFDIRVRDCDSPLADSTIRRAPTVAGDTCTISCPSLSFTSSCSYRGQRAKLLAQQNLGSCFDGQDVHVYCGDISINVQTVVEPHPWVM